MKAPATPPATLGRRSTLRLRHTHYSAYHCTTPLAIVFLFLIQNPDSPLKRSSTSQQIHCETVRRSNISLNEHRLRPNNLFFPVLYRLQQSTPFSSCGTATRVTYSSLLFIGLASNPNLQHSSIRLPDLLQPATRSAYHTSTHNFPSTDPPHSLTFLYISWTSPKPNTPLPPPVELVSSPCDPFFLTFHVLPFSS